MLTISSAKALFDCNGFSTKTLAADMRTDLGATKISTTPLGEFSTSRLGHATAVFVEGCNILQLDAMWVQPQCKRATQIELLGRNEPVLIYYLF